MGNNSSASSAKKKRKSSLNKLLHKSQNKNTNKTNAKQDHDWVLDRIVQFVQSPECTMFVDGFIDEHCLIFDAKNCKINSEYTKIHLEYKRMIESLLISKLSKLGLTAKQFTEAMQKANSMKINLHILQYVTAVDDFSLFQNIMTRRNIELEKEALKYLSQQNVKSKQVNIHNMTEQEQMEWALAESAAFQQQQQQQIMQSLPHCEQYDIIPSAPFASSAPHSPQQKNEVNDKNPFDICQPKRISLKPLKLQKDDTDNMSFEGIKNDCDLPTLTAASIRNIKLKLNQSKCNVNDPILKQKEAILNLRKQRRKEIKSMEAEGCGWNIANLPPLHKSFFAKMNNGECSDDVQITEQ